jgi:hypothetical protein
MVVTIKYLGVITLLVAMLQQSHEEQKPSGQVYLISTSNSDIFLSDKVLASRISLSTHRNNVYLQNAKCKQGKGVSIVTIW